MASHRPAMMNWMSVLGNGPSARHCGSGSGSEMSEASNKHSDMRQVDLEGTATVQLLQRKFLWNTRTGRPSRVNTGASCTHGEQPKLDGWDHCARRAFVAFKLVSGICAVPSPPFSPSSVGLRSQRAASPASSAEHLRWFPRGWSTRKHLDCPTASALVL